MNKETELDMNELISDFDEYSTDYIKTACTYYANYLREYQKEKLDLQQRIDKAIELIEYMKRVYKELYQKQKEEYEKLLLKILSGDIDSKKDLMKILGGDVDDE